MTTRGMVRVFWFKKPFVMGGYTEGFRLQRIAGAFGFETQDYFGFALGHVDQYDPLYTPTTVVGPRMVVNRYWDIGVPFWFLAIPGGVGCIYVWRRTRAPKLGRAFPLDPHKIQAKPVVQ